MERKKQLDLLGKERARNDVADLLPLLSALNYAYLSSMSEADFAMIVAKALGWTRDGKTGAMCPKHAKLDGKP